MDLSSAEINKWYETLRNEALDKNEQSAATWSKYRDDLEATKSFLTLIPKKIKHNVMVPIGSKALMHGTIVHTNEFLVNLGETWFAKKTAHQSIELCDRRIKNCNEVLKKLEQEKELIVNKSTLPVEQEAFGSEDHPEVIEYVTEEENEEWKKQHKIREREYRQQLAELRNKERKSIKTEEDLWRHLDELELQEELEDELNRLNDECSSEDDLSEENTEFVNSPSQENENVEIDKNNSSSENKSDNVKTKRKVSFVCDFDSSDDEPLRLDIKHSSQSPIYYSPNSEEINSPVDIYNHFIKLVNKMPLSVLKNKTSYNKNTNLQLVSNYEVDDKEDEDSEHNSALSVGVHLNDVSERCTSDMNSSQNVDNKNRKVSKFKISRKKGNDKSHFS